MGRPVTTSPCVSLSSSSGTSILSLVTWPWEEDDREKDHGDSRCVPFFPFFLLLSSYTYFISKDGMMKLWRRRRKKGKKHRDQIFFWREVNVFYNQSIIKIKRNGLFIEDYVYSSLSTKKIWVHLRRWTEKPRVSGKKKRWQASTQAPVREIENGPSSFSLRLFSLQTRIGFSPSGSQLSFFLSRLVGEKGKERKLTGGAPVPIFSLSSFDNLQHMILTRGC